MLQHVWERARAAQGIDELVVATDDDRIASAARGWGATVEMTPPECASGTDRVAEVARRHPQAQVILNLQGDEPELETGAVTRLVAAMRADDTIAMGTVIRGLAFCCRVAIDDWSRHTSPPRDRTENPEPGRAPARMSPLL